MSNILKPRILITGATGQVGGKTISTVRSTIEIVAAVRTTEKAAPFTEKRQFFLIMMMKVHIFLLSKHRSRFYANCYTVDMLRQSKALLDNAKKSG
jgi:nucleoside-diphosphate-sugar epimerase